MLSRLLNLFRADFIGQTMIAFSSAGARNKTVWDRIARFIVGLVFTVPKKDDFMADSLIDDDLGFDVEALRRYQRGDGS